MKEKKKPTNEWSRRRAEERASDWKTGDRDSIRVAESLRPETPRMRQGRALSLRDTDLL